MNTIRAGIAIGLIAVLAACDSPANVASYNLSQAADNFEVARRIVFYNGITGGYMLTIQGLCSLGNYDKSGELSVTCKNPDNGAFIKDFLGLSDNVTFFAEQLDYQDVSTHQYRVQFAPSQIIPSIHLQ